MMSRSTNNSAQSDTAVMGCFELKNDDIARPSSVFSRCYTLWHKASIEPTLWFYITAVMVTNVIEQAFYDYKTCRADFLLDRESCLARGPYGTLNRTKAMQVKQGEGVIY